MCVWILFTFILEPSTRKTFWVGWVELPHRIFLGSSFRNAQGLGLISDHIAGWKMGVPDWRCMDPIKHGYFPASYVRLPKGSFSTSRALHVLRDLLPFRGSTKHAETVLPFSTHIPPLYCRFIISVVVEVPKPLRMPYMMPSFGVMSYHMRTLGKGEIERIHSGRSTN